MNTTAFVALKLSSLIVQPSVVTIVPPFALAVTKYPIAIVLLVPLVVGITLPSIAVFPSYQEPLVGVGNPIAKEFIFGNCITFNALQFVKIVCKLVTFVISKLLKFNVVNNEHL